ncbi:HIT family protein [Xylanivirga thermophila]|uniref:HIT family protein n=1 Tax=Xylanivirga thermophila TaxID=2496273 RepID=UPI001A912573|nr:HIT family protein [Xylanivirga thermophila]
MDRCILCDIYNKNKEKVIAENELSFAIYDNFPVNEGHTLILPKRHFDNFFDATQEEINQIYSLIHICKENIDEKYKPTGYNIGVNVGYDGGQTIWHVHIHMIPQYKGDVKNPRGGIRRIKPELVYYEG